MSETMKKARETAEKIRLYVRAKAGLSLENEDKFQGLMNTGKLKERSNLKRHDVFRIDYTDALGVYGGEEWGICKQWAESEMELMISVEQGRALAFIAALSHKTEPIQGPVTQVNIPQTPILQTQQIEQKKKGILG